MAQRLLIDLSNNNPTVDLQQVKRSGIEGLWHKVSEGTSFTDQFWKSRHVPARKIGLRVGGYHFADPDSLQDAAKEAMFFVDRLGAIHRRDLAPVLDLEQYGKLKPHQCEIWARIWMHKVHEQTGIWPLFYSYPAFIESLGASKVIGRGLWLASYGRNDGTEHPYSVPRPFKKALAHQFTSNARVKGVSGRCDLNSAPKLAPLLAYGFRGL